MTRAPFLLNALLECGYLVPAETVRGGEQEQEQEQEQSEPINVGDRVTWTREGCALLPIHRKFGDVGIVEKVFHWTDAPTVQTTSRTSMMLCALAQTRDK